MLGMLGCWDVNVQLLDSGWLRDRFSTAWANVYTAHDRDKFFPAALERAAAAIRQGHTVVVHCVRGRHRTGAFLAALKVRDTYCKPYRLRYYRFVVGGWGVHPDLQQCRY